MHRVNGSHLLHNPWSLDSYNLRTTETVEAQADGSGVKSPTYIPTVRFDKLLWADFILLWQGA